MTDISEGNWRKHLILISMIVMLVGILFSRALLSSAFFVFAVLTIIHKDLHRQVKTFLSSPILWSMTMLFLIPLISGLWSDNENKWIEILRIKLPLLLFPFCFAALNNFRKKDWEIICLAFLLLILAGISISLGQYLADPGEIHAGYLRSNIIQTPVGNDHVRFSLLVTIAIIAAVYLFITNRKHFGKGLSFFLWVLIAVMIVYLHILAVRTGLLSFYICFFIFIAWIGWKKQTIISSALLVFILILLPVVSYFLFPTFRNRISYLKYDLSFAQQNIYLPGSNDGNRIISIKAGWDLLNDHPLTGTGFGDIETATKDWYQQHYPQMNESDKILPSSEWLMHGTGAGWPGFILFFLVMVIPFFAPVARKNPAWWLVNVCMSCSYLFDIGLEVQYGVFIHAFILLWWWKWVSHSE